MAHSCPSCGKQYTPQLPDSWILLCTTCRALVAGDSSVRLHGTSMPDDWSAIQVGTSGTYKGKFFKITGRARLQLPNDFKNLWCASYEKASLWIAQNLEGISFLLPPVSSFEGNYNTIRAGQFVEFGPNVKIKCEFEESCLDLQLEGELSKLPVSQSGFHLAQARNAAGNIALIFKKGVNKTEFLWGEAAPKNFKFDNLKTWDEWK